MFYVQSGTVTSETETGNLTVDADEVLRVPPGTFQLGTNYGDERVTALALGVAREYQDETRGSSSVTSVTNTPYTFSRTPEKRDELVRRCTDCNGETHRITL